MKSAQPIWWSAEGVVMLDQRLLPGEVKYVTFSDYRGVAAGITDMVIRGAPAIGVAAAMGVALGVAQSKAGDVTSLGAEFETICKVMAKTRPTAVDLFWAIQRMKERYRTLVAESTELEKIRGGMIEEAKKVHEEKKAIDEAMGRLGAELMPAQGKVMTQCNAGALATAGIGTALGVIRVAHAAGKKLHVLVPETRPYLQGARLTAWELQQDGIPLTLITDNMVGHFLKSGDVKGIVVGADRIAANGDTANKIGTYPMAVLGKENGVPFYVVAPISTLDLSIASGEQIPIEERSAEEVTSIRGVRIAPDVPAAHPAFDVTPHRYITAIITEKGVARAPFGASLKALVKGRSE